MNKTDLNFPRKLEENEKVLLFSILPENKTGYSRYREKIKELFVIGKGRFGNLNLILGKRDDKPDLSSSSAPIFAAGIVLTAGQEIDVTIHEEIDDQIEIDISPKTSNEIPDEINLIGHWSYSEWMPGDKTPNDNSDVREVEIIPGSFELVIAPAHKKIWLHDYETMVNHLIPVSNFFNELMSVKNIRNPDMVLKPNSFFNEDSKYSELDLKLAFIKYNKYLRRFKINYDEIPTAASQKRKSSFIKNIFKRGKN
jgi:hypothetical protein